MSNVSKLIEILKAIHSEPMNVQSNIEVIDSECSIEEAINKIYDVLLYNGEIE